MEYVSWKYKIKKACHKASQFSGYMQNVLTYKRSKLTLKNFNKLLIERGLSKEESTNLKAFKKTGCLLKVWHAKVGDWFVTTHRV